MAKKWRKSTKAAVAKVKEAGRTGTTGERDTELVHMNKREAKVVDRVLKRYGGTGGKNPESGLREYVIGNVGGQLGGDRGFREAMKGKSTGSSGNKKNDQSVPTQSTGPTPASDTLGSPESAAAANAALGAGGGQPLGDASTPTAGNANTPEAKPKGFTPLGDKKPMGATEYREGADLLGIGATIAGGIAGNVGRALQQGITGEDSTATALGDHLGEQTGWHSDSEFGGKDIGGPGSKKSATDTTKTASKASTASTSGSTVDPGAAAAGASGGGTITVNPDGTVRTQDTSIAGLRAQKRYGAKMKPKAA